MYTRNRLSNKGWRIICACLISMTILVAGCLQTTTTQPLPPKPVKPILEIQENPKCPRGVCLDGDNTRLLLDYIWQLEEGYD